MQSLKLVGLIVSLSVFLSAQEWKHEVENDDPAARQVWFYSQRAYPFPSLPAGARLNAIHRLEQLDAASRALHRAPAPGGGSAARARALALTMDAANWSLIGPEPTDAGSTYVTAGRVNAIAIDPRNSSVVYIGAAEGGVWKTTDGGGTWTPLTDAQASLASGAIALDPGNPDTIYVGTGEENFAQDSYYGAGILKSPDGGATWTNVVGPFLRDKIGAIAVHPTDSQIVICTSTTGIWRSADAGNSWALVLSGTGTSLVFDPTNGSSVYASLGNVNGNRLNGVYHSTDAGLTWKLSAGTGSNLFPTNNVGRIEIAMAPSQPSTLYVQVQNSASGTSFGTLLGIYKTTDGGATWNQLPVANSSLWGNQLWYDNPIRVNPANPNVLYSGGLLVYRSVDGGATWRALAQSGSNQTAIHVDTHALVFTPDGGTLFIGNDGGMYSTTNIASTNVNWTNLNATLSITEFYPGMAVDPDDPQIAVGGTQDNGTQRFDGNASWNNVTCGDAGFQAIDPAYPGLAYGTCQNIAIERTFNLTGSAAWIPASYGIDQTDTVQFIPPFVMDPSKPQTLYFGTYRVWQTTDSAGRWNSASPDLTGGKKGTLKAIAVAPSDSNTVYIGTSNSKVQSTSNAGDGVRAAWTDRSAGLPPRTVTQIAVDPINSATAYVTFSGFSGVTDQQGHVFQTSNGGATWTDISGDMPNMPVNDLVVDPDLPQTLYAGTDAGVMVTTNGGSSWSSLGNGLPRVVVMSLVLQRGSRVLRAATHGRSVWEILCPLSGAPLQPTLTAVNPATVNTGGGDFKLSVTGANFVSQTVLRWNGQSLATSFVDAAHLTVQVPAANIAGVGRVSLTAFSPVSGGGSSNALPFNIGPAPQTASNAVVSAANPTATTGLGQRSIASLFGANLAGGTASALDIAPPLPFSLGGVSITINGMPAPLFFVSPNQVNFQVPIVSTTANTQAQLVITQGVQSTTITVPVRLYAPALFTTNSQGTGQASAIIANTATVTAPVGALPNSRPARIGEFVSIYCTGLGDVVNRPAIGSPSPSSPLASTLLTPAVTFGGVAGAVSFSGLAPTFVGLYQVNVQVPPNAPTGPAVPIVLTINGIASNTATVAIDPAQ